MDPGKCRHRVYIESVEVTGKDAHGAEIRKPVTEGRWAHVETGGGNEQLDAEVMRATGSYTLTMRYDRQLSPKQAIIFDGKRLGIISIEPDDHKQWSTVKCEQAATNGG